MVDGVELVCEILLTKNLCEPPVIFDIVLFGHFCKHALYDLFVLIFFNFFDRKFDTWEPAEGKTH